MAEPVGGVVSEVDRCIQSGRQGRVDVAAERRGPGGRIESQNGTAGSCLSSCAWQPRRSAVASSPTAAGGQSVGTAPLSRSRGHTHDETHTEERRTKQESFGCTPAHEHEALVFAHTNQALAHCTPLVHTPITCLNSHALPWPALIHLPVHSRKTRTSQRLLHALAASTPRRSIFTPHAAPENRSHHACRPPLTRRCMHLRS